MNAKIAILIAEAAESVNMLSWPSLNLFVNGIAADAADMSRYATICKITIRSSVSLNYIFASRSYFYNCTVSFITWSPEKSTKIEVRRSKNSLFEKCTNVCQAVYNDEIIEIANIYLK